MSTAVTVTGKPVELRRGVLRVKARKLGEVRFASTDLFGNFENARRVSR